MICACMDGFSSRRLAGAVLLARHLTAAGVQRGSDEEIRVADRPSLPKPKAEDAVFRSRNAETSED